MTPIKIDIAGIALGALIGLGAILIVPKIAHVFSAGHGFRSKFRGSPIKNNDEIFQV